MTRYSFLVLVALGSLVGGCAARPGPAPSSAGTLPAVAVAEATPAGAAAADEVDPVVCKDVTRTGTRFRTQECARQSQWDAVRQRGRDEHDNVQRRAVHHQDMPGQ